MGRPLYSSKCQPTNPTQRPSLILTSNFRDMVLQIANLTSTKNVRDTLKFRHVGVDMLNETLTSEFDFLRMNVNESFDVYARKISLFASHVSSLRYTMKLQKTYSETNWLCIRKIGN